MIRFFASHPTAANLLMVVILVAGLTSMNGLLRETFPDFTLGEVQVRAFYPGADPAEVEESVSALLQDAVEGVTGIDEVECESFEGLARMIVRIEEGFDFQRFLNDIKTRIEGITDFPDLVERVTVEEFQPTDPVVSVALSADAESLGKLKVFAETVKDSLLRIPGIKIVRLSGVSRHQLKISLNQDRLKSLGMSAADVAMMVKAQNLDVPTGMVETKGQEILVRVSQREKTPLGLEKLVIKSDQMGTEIKLGDIARITDDFEFPEEKITFNDKPAIILGVEKNSQQDSLAIYHTVKKFVETQKTLLPGGVDIDLTQDVASIVEDRLNMLLTNGVQGFVLVFLTLLVFFGLRHSFWVAMGLPVSFIGGLFFMSHLGLTINMISMVGLLMAIGLLMDDAIVISENIAIHSEQGESDVDAAVHGTMEVMPGVLSSYLTTVCVFGALMFLEGDLGRMFRVMPKVLMLVLSVSLVEAFLILPHHLSHRKKKNRQAGHGDSLTDSPDKPDFKTRFRNRIDDFLNRLIHGIIRHRYAFLGSLAALFLACIGLLAGGIIKFSALPDIDGDVIQARLLLPQGTPLERTEERIATIKNALMEVSADFQKQMTPGIKLVRNVAVHCNFNADAFESGPHVATITVDLAPAQNRSFKLDELLSKWRTKVGFPPDMVAMSFKEPVIGPAGRPIQVRLLGSDFEKLKKASTQVCSILGTIDGVIDIMDDLRPGKPEIRLTLKPGALSLGVTGALLANQLRASFHGVDAGTLYRDEEPYKVSVQYADTGSMAELDDFEIITPAGKAIPLSALAEINRGRSWSRRNRINGLRVVTILAEVDRSRVNVVEALALLKKKALPVLHETDPEILMEYQGEVKKMGDTVPSIRMAILLGMAGVFFILCYQFGSWSEPIFIMGAIPLALIGVIFGHLIMKMDLCMPSMVGFISLAGVVVNNSILMVQFVVLNLAKNSVSSLAEAAAMAARQRFRPIVITSATTVAGMLPLLMEKSLQAQIIIPLAVSVIFGITASTILVLLFIPAVYGVMEDWGIGRHSA
jgi:multidrug efflux pump subunit AcrB